MQISLPVEGVYYILLKMSLQNVLRMYCIRPRAIERKATDRLVWYFFNLQYLWLRLHYTVLPKTIVLLYITK